METKILLTFLAVVSTQPFTACSTPRPYMGCLSECVCPSSYEILCRNASLRVVPSAVPKTTVTLDLSCNAISGLTNVSFPSDGMAQLTSLYIYKNIISIVEVGAFRNLRALKSLSMGQNRLTYIHPDTFKHNAELQELDLHGNNVSLGDKGPFHHLANLQLLNISDNNLTSISKQTFWNTMKLIRLDISNNRLTYIDDHLFDHLNSLRFLNLSRNLLTSVHFLLAIPRTDLQGISLYVSTNKLGNFSKDVIERLDSLKNLDIHDNPLSCRCWDENVFIHVIQPCSEHLDKRATDMKNSLNKTCVAEAISRETRPVEISVGEKINYETSELQKPVALKNLSVFDNVNNDVMQQSSKTFSQTETIVVTVLLSLTLVMLVSLIGICFCPRISKRESPASEECDTVPETKNCQQERQCEVCQIYQNHTPTCSHRVSRQNSKASKKHNLNFGIQSSLQTYELTLRGGNEECYLYVPIDGVDLIYCRNPHSDSGQSRLMPSAVSRDELETDTTANRTHPSCTIAHQEDTISERTSDASEYGQRVLNSPRHACNCVIRYVVCPSGSISASGGHSVPPDTQTTNV